jgi:hypothetical protein
MRNRSKPPEMSRSGRQENRLYFSRAYERPPENGPRPATCGRAGHRSEAGREERPADHKPGIGCRKETASALD